MNISLEQLKVIVKEALQEQGEHKLTLTLADAAKVSGIGRDKLTELAYKGELPHFKVGTKTLINREMFIEWLKKKSEQRQVL